MIKAVLFDFGGVLTEGGKAGSIGKIFAEIYGIDQDRVQFDDLHQQLRHGNITDEAFFAELDRRFAGSGRDTKKLFMERTDIFKKSEPVYKLAEELRRHNIKTGILSNVYAMSVERLRAEGFYDGFEPLVLSCELHMSKPEEAFYEVAIDRLGVDPQEILFIDDQEKCMPPAKKLGMHTILAISPEQIVADTVQIFEKENGVHLSV